MALLADFNTTPPVDGHSDAELGRRPGERQPPREKADGKSRHGPAA